jgi:hypothetical protein
MNGQDKNEAMDRLLRRTHEKVEPADSWENLRRRIDARLEKRSYLASARLWRRTAVALAACLAITIGLLCHFTWRDDRAGVPTLAPLLAQDQLDRLSAVFEQIRGVFADEASWFVIDSAGRTQIGVSSPTAQKNDDTVVLRLVLSDDGPSKATQYLDVIARVRRVIDLRVALQDGSSVQLSLVPELAAGGAITLQSREPESGERGAMAKVEVPSTSYTSLGRIRAGDRWVSLHAMARIVPI